jgi:hypothetical protein
LIKFGATVFGLITKKKQQAKEDAMPTDWIYSLQKSSVQNAHDDEFDDDFVEEDWRFVEEEEDDDLDDIDEDDDDDAPGINWYVDEDDEDDDEDYDDDDDEDWELDDDDDDDEDDEPSEPYYEVDYTKDIEDD